MKFLFGFITSTMFIAIMFIGCWLYFDFPISTNDETETYNPPKEVQQQKYNDHIKEQTSPSQAPVSENNVDNTEITPSGLSVEDYNKLDHNKAGTNNQEYAKEHGLIQEDK